MLKFCSIYGTLVKKRLRILPHLYAHKSTQMNIPISRCSNYLAVGYDLRNVGLELIQILKNYKVDLNKTSLFLSEVVLTVSLNVLTYYTINFYHLILISICKVFAAIPECAVHVITCFHFMVTGSFHVK